jgi:putative endopeptidase
MNRMIAKIIVGTFIFINPHIGNFVPLLAQSATAPQPQPGGQGVGKASLGHWGVETQYMSKKVLPGDDFYAYVNEGWLESTTMPPGASAFGTFDIISQKNQERIRDIIREAASSTNTTSGPIHQIRALYLGYLNTDHIEKLGLAPIRHDLDDLLALKSYDDVAKWMADTQSTSIVSIGVAPDPGDRNRLLISLSGGGLGLPGREYYEKTDGPFPAYRTAYLAYITQTFQFAGIADGRKRAEDILALETKLAGLQWAPAQIRDSRINAHLMTPAELTAYAPGFPWKTFLAARDVATVNEIILQTDSALKAEAGLFTQIPVEVWSSYLVFHEISTRSLLLPEAFRKSNFSFYSTTLNGVKEDRPREQQAIAYVNARLSKLIGRLYVERYFPPEYLQQITILVDYLRRAFAERLAKSDWLDDPTRKQAQAKLDALTVRIGYPKVWRDYSGIVLDAKDPIGNERRISKANWIHARSLLDKPFTSNEWNQAPQTVDASSSKQYNAIEFPAGILQPPFFDPYADPAVNFGAIGAIIGHEMGHNFDDQGSQFDAQGVHRDWWTSQARKSFEERTNGLISQYDAFSPIEGLRVNGKQTIGENIGDLTGVVVAHEAYLLYMKDHGGISPVLDGFTGDQRYFLSWAQVWQCLYTPESYRAEISQGYHSSAQYRVNGVVRNIDDWYEDFHVTPDQKLYLPPASRVHIW